uniref:Secreted protein n=1 Tax=Angiostrongylus cantonensis TaxID=6313 RepID=A0A0K0CUT7_ANGCA
MAGMAVSKAGLSYSWLRMFSGPRNDSSNVTMLEANHHFEQRSQGKATSDKFFGLSPLVETGNPHTQMNYLTVPRIVHLNGSLKSIF